MKNFLFIFSLFFFTQSAFSQSIDPYSWYELKTMANGESQSLTGNSNSKLHNGATYMAQAKAGDETQMWRLIPEKGFYRLKNKAAGDDKCLEVNKAGAIGGDAAFLSNCRTYAGQLWTLEEMGDGHYRLYSVIRGRMQSLNGNQPNSKDHSGAAFMDKKQDNPAQMWKLVRVKFKPQTSSNSEGSSLSSKIKLKMIERPTGKDEKAKTDKEARNKTVQKPAKTDVNPKTKVQPKPVKVPGKPNINNKTPIGSTGSSTGKGKTPTNTKVPNKPNTNTHTPIGNTGKPISTKSNNTKPADSNRPSKPTGPTSDFRVGQKVCVKQPNGTSRPAMVVGGCSSWKGKDQPNFLKIIYTDNREKAFIPCMASISLGDCGKTDPKEPKPGATDVSNKPKQETRTPIGNTRKPISNKPNNTKPADSSKPIRTKPAPSSGKYKRGTTICVTKGVHSNRTAIVIEECGKSKPGQMKVLYLDKRENVYISCTSKISVGECTNFKDPSDRR